jgi:cytochrome c biogenesis protein CcmG, thiol:disulfide interchange protein DsbE
MKRPWLVWVPLLAFAILLVVASIGLQRNPQQIIMSRMIDKPIPGLDLPPASSTNPALSTKQLADGKVRLINIFASWCGPCIAEVPQLMALAQRGVPVEGIAIRDARPDVDRFLARHGNPYDRIGLDARSTMQFYLGSSGVPESYIIDGKGIIRYQHWGPIMPQDMEMILAKLKAAQS